MKRNRGFTLVEISLVVIVIALISTIAIPRMLSMRVGHEFAIYRVGLVSMAQKAKRSAMQQQVPFVLQFNGDNLTIQELNPTEIQLEEQAGAAQSGSLTNIAGTEFTAFQVNGETVTQTDWQVTFYPDGTADKAGLEFDQKGRIWHFKINPLQGRATVEEGQLIDEQEDSWEAGTIEQRT